MKFLDSRFNDRHLMPIHVVSYDCFELGARDAVAITFKDMDTDQVFVETIDHPKYEVYITKESLPEKRYMDCWESVENLDRYVISYHNRDRELAHILNCDPNDVKFSTRLFGYDIKIEHYYWIQFLLEYGNDLPKKLNVGFFDIESDVVQADGFASPGEAPTSAITFIDASANCVYTLCLGRDNLPVLAENNPHYEEYQKIKEYFYVQVKDFVDNLDGFIEELHQNFDEFYGVMDYKIMVFEDEIKLHQTFWEIVRSCNLDIIMAWNAPYDVRNLIERPLSMGYEPESIICDNAYKYKTCFFEEDDNVQVHKRNHRAVISIKPMVLCQMWMYAGVRSAQGVLPSVKLNVIAKKELKDEKLNYEEEGSIKTFMYRNYRKYIMYNIKDVLLQLGIHRVTKDIDAIYDRCYDHGMLLPEAFVSTTMLTTSLTKYFLNEGFVMGTNANRIMAPFDYKAFLPDDKMVRDADDMNIDAYLADPDDIEMEQENSEDLYGEEEGEEAPF